MSSDWIPVSERRPAKSGKYIVYGTADSFMYAEEIPDERNHVFICEYDSSQSGFGEWYTTIEMMHSNMGEAFKRFNILYWMPLPLPTPKMESKE